MAPKLLEHLFILMHEAVADLKLGLSEDDVLHLPDNATTRKAAERVKAKLAKQDLKMEWRSHTGLAPSEDGAPQRWVQMLFIKIDW